MSPQPVVLITGASYGVGAQTAIEFAKLGYDLVLTARKIENLESIQATLLTLQVKPLLLALDLQDLESFAPIVVQIDQHFGRLDVLVNNAGDNVRQLALSVTPEQWDRVLNTNLKGTFFISQAVAHYMIKHQRGGHIINVTSVHGLQAAVERTTYGVSKAGLIHLTKMLALEWATHHIRVNAVAPGRLMTDSPSRHKSAQNEQYMNAMLTKIPLHRLATVEEVSAAIAFLTSPGAASITGQTLVLDGGLTL
jgi:NAD(P)-dependent dehydrogenase (short-subunit alcohol dehydrogenase family)